MPYEYSPNAIYSEAAYRDSLKTKAPPAQYDEAQACQVPYTEQLNNRLDESEKRLAELIMRANRLTERLFGPAPTLARLDDPSKTDKVPIDRSMIDRLLVQTNQVNRKLEELSNVLARFESL